jgi:hypothetical protein
MGRLLWTMSIVWDFFDTHEISIAGRASVISKKETTQNLLCYVLERVVIYLYLNLMTEEEQVAEALCIFRAPQGKDNIRRIILNVHWEVVASEVWITLKEKFLIFWQITVSIITTAHSVFYTSFGRMDGLPWRIIRRQYRWRTFQVSIAIIIRYLISQSPF